MGVRPAVLVGALLNARAVASAAAELADQHYCSITVLACGERWETQDEDGELRFAIEDYLGAGAILSYIALAKSPEAEVCAAAFRESCSNLESCLWDCCSGIELRDRGHAADVLYAFALDIYNAVPILSEGGLVKMKRPENNHGM